MPVMDSRIAYLAELEQMLHLLPPLKWDFPPQHPPPPMDEPALATEDALVPSQVAKKSRGNALRSNPFASIADSADEDEDLEDLEEADDQPILQKHPPGGMDLLRLLIRICTSSADLWASKGAVLAHERQWPEGAHAMQCAIIKIRQALEQADAQISQWYQQETDNDRKRDLQQDADIVHVAIQSLVIQCDRYTRSARRQAERLQRILQPQWQSRDEVKERWGADKWSNNPNRKDTHAKIRKESELELCQL